MKILLTIIMTMTITSVFAGECKLNSDCDSDKDCKELNKDYGVVKGKCVALSAAQSETKCADILSGNRTNTGKGSGSDAPAAGDGKETTQK
jgi:hypothetical protein